MGHKNYSKHFKKAQQVEPIMEGQITFEEVVVTNPTIDPDTIPTVEPVENAYINTTTVKGIVDGCSKLYVRTKPNKESEYLCVIEKGNEVEVDLTASTNDFYKVYTSFDIEGYCMKKFISIK